MREKSAYLAEVGVTEQILRKFPNSQKSWGELSMRKQCVPGSFLSAHALEPGNEAKLVATYCQSGISGDIGEPERVYYKRCVCAR